MSVIVDTGEGVSLLTQAVKDLAIEQLDQVEADLAAHIAKGLDGHDSQLIVKDGMGLDVPYEDTAGNTVALATLKLGVDIGGVEVFVKVPAIKIDTPVLDNVIVQDETPAFAAETVDNAVSTTTAASTTTPAGIHANLVTTELTTSDPVVLLSNLEAHVALSHADVHGIVAAVADVYQNSGGDTVGTRVVRLIIDGTTYFVPATPIT